MSKRLLLFLLCFWYVAMTDAGVYKWVDDHGVTHYSETPPAGRKSQQVRISPPPSEEAVKESQRRLQKLLQERHQPEEVPKTEGKRRAAEKLDEAERRRRCLTARQQLRVLKLQLRVYQVNEQCERVYLDDNARPAEIKRFEEEIATNCESGEEKPKELVNSPPSKEQLEQWLAARKEMIKEGFCRCAPFRLREMEKPETRTPSSEIDSYKREMEASCK